MNDVSEPDTNADEAALAHKRRALRAGIDRANAGIRSLPAAEQKRLYEEARTQSPTLFALLYRLQEDPFTDTLVRAAVERTRRAPSTAELTRAIARNFNSALRAGSLSFRATGQFVLLRLREEFGDDNARRVKLCELQRGYLAVTARSRFTGFEPAAAVMAVSTIDQLRAGWYAVPTPDQADTQANQPNQPNQPDTTAARFERDPAAGGVPVENHLLATGLLAACLHIEAGVHDFHDFAETMAADLGDAVRPYLRVFYEAIRHFPGIDLSAMKSPAAGEGGFMFAAQ